MVGCFGLGKRIPVCYYPPLPTPPQMRNGEKGRVLTGSPGYWLFTQELSTQGPHLFIYIGLPALPGIFNRQPACVLLSLACHIHVGMHVTYVLVQLVFIKPVCTKRLI